MARARGELPTTTTTTTTAATQGHELHRAVQALLRQVGRDVIMPRFRQLAAGDILEKTPGEVVTIADREAEALLTAGLTAILPEARVLGEEACAANPALMNGLDRGQVWIVDPLDGTANFVAGLECFGIIVALARDGVTEMAWLFDPVNDRMSHAARGGGAYVDGRQIPLGEEQPARPIAALATQFMNDLSRESLLRRAEAAYDVRPIPRCAAEHYPRLALRENHVALFQRTLPWDHAAGALFLTEAGGKVSRWDGSPYCFHDDRLGIVAASSPALWQAAMTTLIGDGLNPAPHRHRVSRSTS